MADPKKTKSNRCRVCGNEIPATRDTTGPFCSERCRLNDLSKWFSENYRIASSPATPTDSDSDLGDE
jgi:endogenous inhibitor of DNA gyrase (YacG/DUF329 family)